jgi:hypothetical protein
MKRITAALTALSFVALIPVTGYAQTYGSSSSDTKTRSTTERTKRDRQAWSNTQGLHESSDIIGATVEAPDGKDLGKVDALLMDSDGKVSHAVIGVGGLLGVGEDKVVVPFSALKMSHDSGRKAKITVDQAALDQAPKYVKASERQPAASPRTGAPSSTGTSTTPADTKK